MLFGYNHLGLVGVVRMNKLLINYHLSCSKKYPLRTQFNLNLNTMQRQGVLWNKPYLPPRPSIRSLSLGSSGLWSCVTSTALMNGTEGSSWIPRTTAESPTWATYMRFPRMKTTLAVVPDVLGRPVSVFGHSAEKMKEGK